MKYMNLVHLVPNENAGLYAKHAMLSGCCRMSLTNRRIFKRITSGNCLKFYSSVDSLGAVAIGQSPHYHSTLSYLTVRSSAYRFGSTALPLPPLLRPWHSAFHLFAVACRGFVVCARAPLRKSASTAVTPSPSHQHQWEMGAGKTFERLPKHVSPKHYILSLTPNLKTCVFEGQVSVQIEVTENTDSIVLNGTELEINEVSLQLASGGDAIHSKQIHYDTENEIIQFEFADTIAKGLHDLNIKFSGILNDQMRGFYRSNYQNEAGEDGYMAVTQFEPVDARRCFPCWDEPAVKATFDIKLTVPKYCTALSNMPIKNTTAVQNGSSCDGDDKNSLIQYEFERSPIMSTYLVAAVVGEFDYVEEKSEDGIMVRVYTPLGKKEQGLFALHVATKVLPYYKNYFDVSYPLPKIDLIAIKDFSAGAMENWGLVTYRETCLLVDPCNSSSMQKQRIALVVGHEIAHQWFGNLVTMEWWTHLWLNEGYASFVEYLCVDHLFPDYEIWTQFINDTHIRALELDGLQNSHPIEVPIVHPSEIDEIFDDISYNKGASVIRMLHTYIGDRDFRRGMHDYLLRHQYKNASTQDLWYALEKASGKPIAKVMSSWTKQQGYPVLQVKVNKWHHSDDSPGVYITITQQQFSLTPTTTNTVSDQLWMVPIKIATNKEENCIDTMLEQRSMDIFVPNVTEKDVTSWLKLNSGVVGFYRVQYEQQLLDRFESAIRNRSMPSLDRLNLIDDLFAMVLANKAHTTQALKLLLAYKEEVDYTVWQSINNILGKLSVVVAFDSDERTEEAFKKYQRDLLSSIAGRLGWRHSQSDSHLQRLLRSLIMSRLAWTDDKTNIEEAKRLFKAHVANVEEIPVDLRSACYRTAARSGGQVEYDQLLKLYRNTDLSEEKDRISMALGATKDPILLNKTLQFSVSNEVRSQDTVFVIHSVAQRRPGTELAWKFFTENVDMLDDRFKNFLITRLVKSVTENFASDSAAEEVEEFFKHRKLVGTERTLRQALETIRLNANLLKRDCEGIRQYLFSI